MSLAGLNQGISGSCEGIRGESVSCLFQLVVLGLWPLPAPSSLAT